MAASILEARLEGHFINEYRRIWVQTTRLGGLCVTLFPVDGSQYRILSERRFGEIDFERVRDFIASSTTE